MAEFARIIPLLVYEDIPAAHDFLVGAFGFAPGGVQYDTDGQPIHAEVRVGALAVWLHQVTAGRYVSPRAMDAASSGLVIHVDDVDAHCENARAHGRTYRGRALGQALRAARVRCTRSGGSLVVLRDTRRIAPYADLDGLVGERYRLNRSYAPLTDKIAFQDLMSEWQFEYSMFTVARREDAWRYWSDMRNHARMEPGVN